MLQEIRKGCRNKESQSKPIKNPTQPKNYQDKVDNSGGILATELTRAEKGVCPQDQRSGVRGTEKLGH